MAQKGHAVVVEVTRSLRIIGYKERRILKIRSIYILIDSTVSEKALG